MAIKLKGRRTQYQLSRCPFCNARVYVHEVGKQVTGHSIYRIQCGKCGCSLPSTRRLPKLMRRWFGSARLHLRVADLIGIVEAAKLELAKPLEISGLVTALDRVDELLEMGD